ncbi:PREDICTED: protein ECT2 isoform X2 [Ceratosolen solmsi marchali]|uniref:Protein ECT2 isoform X2 n=1 Tax=Ceratosolen solmsi marchali TaxID=326594 RepID=A0AAJ6YRG6_9HYME|nr:PREDICTED: protein ECT2 isoform X2 [Ceratosolen solmsi marchali]
MEEQSVHSSTSDINSEEAKTEYLIIPRKKRICLVGAAGEDPALGAAAQQFSVPVLKSETGIECLEDTTYCTYFILKKFEGTEYDVLYKSAHRILGPTALLQLAEKKESLPSINRPMYTQTLLGTVVVFTGFRKKDELTKLVNMIHFMGGSIRKEMGSKVTHLIANCCGGEKYRYAVTFRVPIMSMNWVTALWDMRNNISNIRNNDEWIATFKLKPFVGARVCFFGFPEDEKRHMCEVLQQQGGEPTEIVDPNCTHVVTDLGKRRHRITDSAKKSLHYFKLPYDTLHFEFTLANVHKLLPYSFAYYNPYTITIPSPTKSVFASHLFRISKHKYRHNSKVMSQKTSSSQDSAICMDFSNNLMSSSNKCVTMSFRKIDEENEGNKCQPYKSGCLKEFSDNISNKPGVMEVDSEEDVNKVHRTKIMRHELGLDYEKSGNIFSASMSSRSCSLVTFSSIKKVAMPRRYIKWKKSSSYSAMSKQVSVYNCSEPKLRSHKSKRHDYQYSVIFPNDTVDTTASDKKKTRKSSRTFSKALKQSSALFSKISEIVFPSTFKQYMPVTPYRVSQHGRKEDESITRQKYTPLQSPLPIPAKMARLSSGSECRVMRMPHEQHNYSQTQCGSLSNMHVQRFCGTNCKKDVKQTQKSFLVVVDESNVNALPDLASARAHIVKAEWFWISVQKEFAADEKEYLFEDYLESVMSPSTSTRRDSQAATPTTASTRRKRKRLAETLSSLVQNGADSPALHKRRSSISDAGHLSVSGSFLDCTASPDKQLLDEVEAVNTESTRKNLSPRHQVFLELVQTESNYVGILSTIMTLFKSPLEDLIENSGELLNSTEAKIIFGNFPPIYEVHKKMLEELRYCAAHWSEENSIGNIFLKFASDLVKAYPPYVNFFENTKEMLDQCDQNKPRFHAFLKICQTKPECGRQSLKELLIKPVQRLPSISLLLNDILKHTNKSNTDHSALEKSLSSIKEVMTYINEDKRKTEGQLAMFDIFNEIDNCPPHLVSSHRSFIGKCDVQELSEGLSGRGDHLVLFLFTDTLEICKKRSKAFNSMKSPNTVNGLHSVKMSQGKPYKHIKMLSLSTVKKVVDIRETDECRNVFALMVRSNQELKEKLYSFTITDEEVNKTNYLRSLCRQMANTVCKADADTFLISLDSHQLEIDTSDVALGTLSKAFKSLFHNFYLEYMDPFASRTRMKVGRAFSFNKTPSKLKRAMSTMMSPFGSTNSLTPASQQLAQMRLASCNNINELGNGGSGSPSRDEVLVAPMSVQPTRKAKCSTLSMASLRRL